MTFGVIFEVSFFSTLIIESNFFLTQQRKKSLISLQPTKMSKMNLIQNNHSTNSQQN